MLAAQGLGALLRRSSPEDEKYRDQELTQLLTQKNFFATGFTQLLTQKNFFATGFSEKGREFFARRFLPKDFLVEDMANSIADFSVDWGAIGALRAVILFEAALFVARRTSPELYEMANRAQEEEEQKDVHTAVVEVLQKTLGSGVADAIVAFEEKREKGVPREEARGV